MKVYYLFTLCLFKVGRLFSKLAIPKYMFFFLLSSVKRRHILCTGEHGKWNIKCIIFYSHECLCEILHLISTVVCQMLTLYCGKGGGGVQKYFLYAQMTIQCVECAITEIYLLLVARNL